MDRRVALRAALGTLVDLGTRLLFACRESIICGYYWLHHTGEG